LRLRKGLDEFPSLELARLSAEPMCLLADHLGKPAFLRNLTHR
jgi:hypothetical protein